MWVGTWDSVGRIVIVGPLVYLSLVLLLRVSGKRTLSKLNAFDLVVTVALGSTLSTAILSKDTPLTDALVALAVLVALQLSLTWLSVRFAAIRDVVRAEPRMLVYQGVLLESALRGERLTEDEVLQAIRRQGMGALARVHAAVLETDGRISVIAASDDAQSSPLPGAGHGRPGNEPPA